MPAAPAPQTQSTLSADRVFTSEALFDGAVEVVILHRGTPYRLRLTRQDKLILTK